MQAPHPPTCAAILGAHGRLADWVFSIVRRLAEEAPQLSIAKMDRFDVLEVGDESAPIILCNYPSVALLEAIAAGRVRVLFLIEPPHRTLAFMQSRLGITAIDAIRSQTASAVANIAVGASAHTTILRSDTSRSVLEVVQLIADHLDANLPNSAIQDIALASGMAGSVQARLADALAPDDEPRDTSLDTACQLALEPVLRFAERDDVRPIVWPTEVFTFHDNPDRPPPLSPEIAGPSRNLYYGPYLYLPPANYRVEANLVFSRDFPEVPFVIEVHSQAWLAKARISERLAGRYRGYFHLHHADPTAAIEIRLRNESPVANGHLSLVELLFFVER